MFTADKWQQYKLIDAEGGERLEDWNGRILIRPDPQIIWHAERKSPLWRKADGIYRRSSEGGGKWIKKEFEPEWQIAYGDLKFTVCPMGFKHTGLFPEQAANWEWFSKLIRECGRPIKLLNLFAYTGGATIAAAKAGAFVCHVDAAKGMVQKARTNALLSGIPDDRIRWIVDDCFKFTERELRRGSKYDAVILDPPSFGRGPRGEKWIMEDNLDKLVAQLTGLLSDRPLFVLLNSYTTGLSAATSGCILHNNLTQRFGGRVESGELRLPIIERGFCLPCGSAGRWIADR